MLQDYWMNRRLETDVMCDHICALANEKGIPIPANLWLREQLALMLQKRTEMPVDETAVKGLSARKGHFATPELIANQLRIDIIKARYSLGEKLAENDLAVKFAASRSSVRTALQILSNEGLLHTLPNGRREVVGFSGKQLEDLYDMRWLVENKALELLFQKEQTVYPLLTQALGEIEQKYRNQSKDIDWNDLDVLFHRNLVKSADNVFLANAWESCVQVWYATMAFSGAVHSGAHYAAEFFGEHRHLYKLILSGDRAVFPALSRHIEEEKSSALLMINSVNRV
jgi:DNA-binding GntR family transcriptional regulator